MSGYDKIREEGGENVALVCIANSVVTAGIDATADAYGN